MVHIPTASGRRRVAYTLTSLLGLFTVFTPGVWAAKTAADYVVTSLPGQPHGPLLSMHAGHIEITPEHNGNLFFWQFDARYKADSKRTVIWLNGGPGCSSLDGALLEVGPYRITTDGQLYYNDGSWDQHANVLFIDNPVGTGYSYVDGNAYTHELPEMAAQLMIFLEKYFELFPEHAQDDLYIAGESFAGEHIPYVAQYMQWHNGNQTAADKKWNLKGLLIGNGWISPVDQYPAYVAKAYSSGILQGGTDAAKKVEAQLSDCLTELGRPGASTRVNIGACEIVLQRIMEVTSPDNLKTCYNMYDLRLKDSYPACGSNWPPDLKQMTPYLQQQEVRQALHVNPEKREGWTECAGSVSSTFTTRNSQTSFTLLAGLLESGLPILLFSGEQDMICNNLGTEALMSRLSWSGAKGMVSSDGKPAPQRNWVFEGENAGVYQSARNLTYVKIFNSSHMVPFDYPRRARDMLERFMSVGSASVEGETSDHPIVGELKPTPSSTPSTAPDSGSSPSSSSEDAPTKEELRKAELKAYYRSGEAALIVVLILAVLFFLFVWRQRRRDKRGYMRVHGPGTPSMSMAMNGSTAPKGRDVEAGDFDESELDDLGADGRPALHAEQHYDLASDSEEEDDAHRQQPKSGVTKP